MSIKTNKKYWEELILKNKKDTLDYLQNGMVNLKLIPQGKPLSLFIGGKLEKQSQITKEKKKKENNNVNKNEQNIKDESFNFDNFFDGQNMNDINELFGLDDNSKNEKINNDLNINKEKEIHGLDLDLDALDDKTNDKTDINKESENILKNINSNIAQKNSEIENNCKHFVNNNENINNNINQEDSYFQYQNDILDIFKDDFNNSISNINNNNNIPLKINNKSKEKPNINNNQNNKHENENENDSSYDADKVLEQYRQEFDWDDTVDDVNLKYFGYKKFRKNQREIINASLCDKDIFVCMPTGGGKSLTYQIPALVRDGVTLVVMPLLSLIQDQTTYLKGCGINVLFLNSENSINLNYNKLFHSENEEDLCKMIFLTPEKIAQSNKTKFLLNNLYNDGLLLRCVVDEAHCVSKWGREFRKDYLNLKKLKQDYPKLPILALTATAPNKIMDDVINQLGMKDPVIVKSSYNRTNLYIEIRQKTKGYIEEIADFIKEKFPHDSGLIYCSTKKNCESMAKELKTKHKIKCEFYHASITEQKKIKIQEKWKNNQIQVIVATVAFGMGINKSDVRFVIHNSMPSSFESYYQEIGRAGRDGEKSHCILYYSPSDRKSIEFLMNQTNLDEKKKSESLRKITQMVDYCEEQFECRRVMALKYFDEKFDSKDCNLMCDNCNKKLTCEKKDVTDVSLKILDFVKNCSEKNLKITVVQSVDYLMGKNGKQHMSWPSNDKNKGALSNLTVERIKKIIRKIILLGYIDEFIVNNGNNIYSRIAISPKGRSYLYTKKENIQNNLDNIYITIKGQQKILVEEQEETDEEDIIETSSILESSEKKEEESTNKKLKSSTRKKKKKKKTESIDEEDFGLCTNKLLFDELFMMLKNKRGVILRRENNSNENDDEDDDNSDFSIFNKQKNLGLDDIFTDNGLKELCRKLPIEEKELDKNNIFGVNENSLKLYGKEFLPIINEFIKKNRIKKEEVKELYKEKEERQKKIKKEKKEKKRKEMSEKKSEKKSGKKEKKKKNKENSEESEEDKEEKKEDENIDIPDIGVFNFNEEDLELINEELYESKNSNEIKKIIKEEINEDDELELEEMKKDYSSQKEQNEILDNIISQAKDLAKKDMKKHKRSQIDSDSDDLDDDGDKKKKKGWQKYNYFQRKAIFNKINKGRFRKKK